MATTFKQFLLAEATKTSKKPYQIRLETPGMATGSWHDVALYADSLDDIARAVSASPRDNEAHDKFGLHQLTELVENHWIGVGPDGPGSTWDEIDFDVKSHSDDVLKISFAFSGVNMRKTRAKHNPDKYGEAVTKKGIITIMPGHDN